MVYPCFVHRTPDFVDKYCENADGPTVNRAIYATRGDGQPYYYNTH
jgi:hypothetical protein